MKKEGSFSDRQNVPVEEMTEKELRLAKKEITARLKEIEDERKERERKKRDYTLKTPEQKYRTNYITVWNLIKKHIDMGGIVDSSNIDSFFQKGQDAIPIKNEEIYPCPECGQMSLFIGEYGDPPFVSKKKVTCSCCDFDYKAKYTSNDYDAWILFHNWLVGQGYLPQ